MSPTASHRLRTDVCNLAPADWAAAEAVAARVEEPWYAAQAYAWCGRFAPAAEAGRLVGDSLRSARAGKDEFERLAANAWPLRALLELGRVEEAIAAFDAATGAAVDIEHPGRRAEACFLVFQAVAVGPRALAVRAFQWLIDSLRPCGHWRRDRVLREAAIQAVTLGLIEPAEAIRLVNDERVSPKIAARHGRGERREPRMFFWQRR